MPHDHHAPFELRKDLDRRLAQYRELVLGSLEGVCMRVARMHDPHGLLGHAGVIGSCSRSSGRA